MELRTAANYVEIESVLPHLKAILDSLERDLSPGHQPITTTDHAYVALHNLIVALEGLSLDNE